MNELKPQTPKKLVAGRMSARDNSTSVGEKGKESLQTQTSFDNSYSECSGAYLHNHKLSSAPRDGVEHVANRITCKKRHQQKCYGKKELCYEKLPIQWLSQQEVHTKEGSACYRTTTELAIE